MVPDGRGTDGQPSGGTIPAGPRRAPSPLDGSGHRPLRDDDILPRGFISSPPGGISRWGRRSSGSVSCGPRRSSPVWLSAYLGPPGRRPLVDRPGSSSPATSPAVLRLVRRPNGKPCPFCGRSPSMPQKLPSPSAVPIPSATTASSDEGVTVGEHSVSWVVRASWVVVPGFHRPDGRRRNEPPGSMPRARRVRGRAPSGRTPRFVRTG